MLPLTQNGSKKRSKIIKFLKKIWGKKLHDMAFGNNFLDMTPKTQATKGKIDKVNFFKILSCCVSKDTIISSMKDHPQNKRKYL